LTGFVAFLGLFIQRFPNIETEEIIRLKKDTRNALATLNKAFSGQFEKLMRGELTDMQAEIELLEQTVKMEMDK
ncbi:MAG: hypothetical protein ACI4KF_08850, partial [Huintestinicola sp.]